MRHFLALVLTLCAACGASAPSPDYSIGDAGGDASDGPRCLVGQVYINAHCTPASDVNCGDTHSVCRSPQVCSLACSDTCEVRCEAP